MIRIDRLTKRYPEFDMELDLAVEAGELVSVLGPSGSGKTTTLRLIAGFEQPDRGRIFIHGEDVTTRRPADRHVGYVFQDYTLFPHMNVAQNIGYGLRIRRRDATTIASRVDELLELMDLPGYAKRRVDTLSGGERQRVAIARALAVDPVLLLLDEPFSSIDEVLRRGLRREIVRLQKELGITVLFVTHSRQEALSISDRVAVLQQGRLIQFGSPANLYHRPVNEFVAGFVGEVSMVPQNGGLRFLRPEDIRLEEAGHGATGLEPARPLRAPAADGRSDTSVSSIRAVVRSREFLGFAWLYELECEYGRLLAYDSRAFEAETAVVASWSIDTPANQR